MAKELYTASEAAAALGISLDTLRRWDKSGRIAVERDAGNRRVVRTSEIDRVRGDAGGANITARNRFHGTVAEVKVDGLMAQVRAARDRADAAGRASSRRDAVEELGLKKGMAATAIRVDQRDGAVVIRLSRALSQPVAVVASAQAAVKAQLTVYAAASLTDVFHRSTRPRSTPSAARMRWPHRSRKGRRLTCSPRRT
jgi:excisionase family DNA binding protein